MGFGVFTSLKLILKELKLINSEPCPLVGRTTEFFKDLFHTFESQWSEREVMGVTITSSRCSEGLPNDLEDQIVPLMSFLSFLTLKSNLEDSKGFS